VKSIRTQIEETTSDYDKEKLQERVAKLAGAFAIVKVGAATEIEMKERKARVEDALHATRAAVEEGIVAGGGVAYIAPGALWTRSRATTPTRRPASRSCAVPWKSRCVRSSPTRAKSPRSCLTRSPKARATSASMPRPKAYGDLVEMGVVDPTNVARTALQNAASVAGLLLTTEAMVAELVEEKEGATPAATAWAGWAAMPGWICKVRPISGEL